MTSRERALAALNHREPDRVPIDLGSTIVTTVTRTAYDALRLHLGLSPDSQPNISHRQMDTVYPKEDLLGLYRVDFRPVYLRGPWYFKMKSNAPWTSWHRAAATCLWPRTTSRPT